MNDRDRRHLVAALKELVEAAEYAARWPGSSLSLRPKFDSIREHIATIEFED